MKRFFLVVVVLLFLVGCGGEASLPSVPTVASSAPGESPTAVLPAPTTVSNTTGYPAAMTEGGYPVPVPEDTAVLDTGYPPAGEPPRATDGVLFSINGPLVAGQTTITGTAPPLLSLAIANVTYNGSLLSTGSSDADGNFTITVPPLPSGVRLGITLSQLDNYSSMDEAATALYPYRGENFMNIPNVGFYFETIKVEN